MVATGYVENPMNAAVPAARPPSGLQGAPCAHAASRPGVPTQGAACSVWGGAEASLCSLSAGPPGRHLQGREEMSLTHLSATVGSCAPADQARPRFPSPCRRGGPQRLSCGSARRLSPLCPPHQSVPVPSWRGLCLVPNSPKGHTSAFLFTD